MSLVLLRGNGESAAAKAAATALDRHGRELLVALKRALPFLVRRNATMTVSPSSVTTLDEIDARLVRPSLLFGLGCRNGAPGVLGLDATLLGILIDGVLGGSGTTAAPTVLSPGQTALATHIAESMTKSFSDVLQNRLGFSITPVRGDAPRDGAMVALTIEIVVGEQRGRAILGIAQSAIQVVPTARVSFEAPPVEPGVSRAVSAVEIDVSVELGRISICLDRLTSLRSGETLVADIPVGQPVLILAEGQPLFSGHPTAIAGQFAVRIEKRV